MAFEKQLLLLLNQFFCMPDGGINQWQKRKKQKQKQRRKKQRRKNSITRSSTI
jgi:hypothetical protein